MKKQFYLFTGSIFWLNVLFAQTNQGSRLTAMGNNGVAVKDVWGVVANPATISNTPSLTVQLSHQEHHFSKAIRNQAVAVILPANRQTFGLGFQRYGIPEYHHVKIGVVGSRQFGPKLAIGFRVNYHQLKIDNYGVTTGISVDMGAIYQLSTEFSLGLYMNNLSKEDYRSKNINTALEPTAYIGAAYRTSSKLLLASSLSEDDASIGMDYQLIQAFSIRGGISIHPFKHYAGIGFSKSKFMADFTVTKHSNFGYSPQLTIGYAF